MTWDIPFRGSPAGPHIGQVSSAQAQWPLPLNARGAQRLRCREIMFVEFDQACDVLHELRG
jgi:hypothetical protein